MNDVLTPPPAPDGAGHHPDPETERSRWHHRLAEASVLFPIIGAVILMVLWAGTLNLVNVQHESADRSARVAAAELVETYEAQMLRVLREVDQTLKALQYSVALRGDGPQAFDDLATRDLLPPSLFYRVTLANADGEIEAANWDAPPSLGDRGLVDALRAQPWDALVEGPATDGEGERWLAFGRRLSDPDGNYYGAALLEVDAHLLVSGYDPAKLGSQGFLAVLGDDGAFRVRRTGEQVDFDGQVRYQAMVTGDQMAGTEVRLREGEWDEVERYLAARPLFGFPLAVAVGLSETEVRAPTEERARAFYFRAGMVSVLVVVILLLLGRLSRRVENLKEREKETRERHARRVEHLAYHDSLTGLPNRFLLGKLMDDRIRLARRFQRKFAVLFLDLDGFKQVNDTLGHDAGDDLLREVASRLEATLRESDTVARMGGDEFMILLPEVESEDQAAAVARKVLEALQAPVPLLGEQFQITVSIGVSIFPRDGEDEQSLMKSADIAMYQAKDAGKNDFRFFSPEMNAATRERLDLEAGLRKALAQEEFVLHYQVRRSLGSGQITGVEALLRWEHPTWGTVGPMKFLPLAEDTGLILPIGRWVLRTACEQNARWQAEVPGLTMAVNLSPRQFFDTALLADVRAALAETGLDANLLELEICESALAREPARTLPILRSLKEIGVRITVDNFGTGYSSLAILGQLPLDTVKIDRVFLRDDQGAGPAAAVMDAVLAMGRSLGPAVVAQGVETREQAELLQSQVFDQVQGFYYNHPGGADEITQLLAGDVIATAGAAWE